MRSIVWLVAVLGAGCGGGSEPAVDGPGEDGASVDGAIDGAALIDAGGDGPISSSAAITCGTETCTLPAEACCVHTEAPLDQCDLVDDAFCPDAHPLFCDGPEDCAGDTVCCYTGQASYCIDAASCTATPGAPMCHEDVDCDVGVSCCSILPGRPYEACGAPSC